MLGFEDLIEWRRWRLEMVRKEEGGKQRRERIEKEKRIQLQVDEGERHDSGAKKEQWKFLR